MLTTSSMRSRARLGLELARGAALTAVLAALTGCGIKVVGGGGGWESTGGTGGTPGLEGSGGAMAAGGAGGTSETGETSDSTTSAGGAGGAGGATTVTEISGACIVRDAYTNMPNFDDPNVGPGYAKLAIPGVNDLDALEAACTNAIYQSLLAQHCATGSTEVQAEVVTYSSDGQPYSSTCGSLGCDFISCPSEISGACIVRDPYTSLPEFGDPDVGPGYAKQAVPGVNDIDALKAACTDAIYQSLLAQHCATGSTEVQAEVVTYFSNGQWSSTGCGSIGCDFIFCP